MPWERGRETNPYQVGQHLAITLSAKDMWLSNESFQRFMIVDLPIDLYKWSKQKTEHDIIIEDKEKEKL